MKKTICKNIITSILIAVAYPVSFLYALYQRQQLLKTEYEKLDE